MRTSTTIAVSLLGLLCWQATGCIEEPRQPGEIGTAYRFGQGGADELASLGLSITDGEPHAGHPAVGLLRIDGGGLCTATLIGPAAVLTAAHCLGRQLTFKAAGQQVEATRSVRYPQGADVALVLLERAVKGVDPIPLYREVPEVGQPIILVGFGATAFNRGDTAKRIGTNEISYVDKIEYGFFQSSNICQGDSGGPSFVEVDGREYVVGVHSRGFVPRGSRRFECGYAGVDMRVDVFAEWIDSEVEGYEAPPVGDGDPGDPPATDPPEAPPTRQPATPVDPHAASEGQSCAQVTCGSGLNCTPVYARQTWGYRKLGQFCMERCTPPDTASVCDSGETCTRSNANVWVCVNPYNPDQGFTTPVDDDDVSDDPAPPEEPGPPDAPDLPDDPDPPVGACGMNAQEAGAFELANQARADAGLDPLACDADAVKAARAHSEDMCVRNYFSHVDPEGRNPGHRLRDAGISFWAGGENIAKGQPTAAMVHTGWMRSLGHRSNILRSYFTHVGLGFVRCPSDRYFPSRWTQLFFRAR